MKVILLLIVSLLITACVQSVSNRPLLGTQTGKQTIGIINVYPNEITYFKIGPSVFQNEYTKRNPLQMNISDYIGSEVKRVFSKVEGLELKHITISDQEKSRFVWQEDESELDYEKKIQAIPAIVNKFKQQQINTLIIIVPSNIIIPNSNIFTWGSGLWYFFNGIIEPYSAISLYLIDTRTSKILGKHELTSHGEQTKLKNDLPESLIRQIKKDAAKKDYGSNEGNSKFELSVESRIAVECAKIERIDEYSNINQMAITKSLKQSIDHSVSKLENIYFGTTVKKLKNWRQTWSLSTPYSCEI